MTHTSSAILSNAASEAVRSPRVARFALLGNPNTGKTTLFGRLCGIRAKTANFPGSTVEAHVGSLRAGERLYHMVDLPGTYSLELDLPESRLCRDCLAGALRGQPAPDGLLIIIDATNLPRGVHFAAEALRRGIPGLVALNMIDLARKRGLSIDPAVLRDQIGCPVVAICARTGEGVEALKAALASPGIGAIVDSTQPWRAAAPALPQHHPHDLLTDRLDKAFTHPILGLAIFAALMSALFMAIFWLAAYPMQWIEGLFGLLGGGVRALLPAGAIADLLADGVVAGIAGTVVFLPQICLLFFLISILEDTGYLARAALLMDRMLRRFGLSGHAFVPLLSAHACAIPAIMSTRLIPDRRDRLATILVAPFMSCSARLPVYVLLIGLLFAEKPVLAGLAFTGCYLMGAAAALVTALLARRTILKGPARPMVMELPSYKLPSLRTALLTTYDRALVFLRKAGTVIVSICIVLWWLSSYPRVAPPAEAVGLREQAAALAAADSGASDLVLLEAERIESRHAASSSFIGQLGRMVEPVFVPLGYDWQLSIGVLSSFAAREVFVSTMAVVLSASAIGEDADDPAVRRRIEAATRDDGSPLFTTATSASLLVFYVLAMQCLPTLSVTRRETGSWWWAALQLGYMSALAYVAALVTHGVLILAGVT